MKKSDAKEIIKILKETYPEATCSLDFKNPFEMAIAVMLSAQCTDERVNKVTDVVSLGDEILVKALGKDKKGREDFSRKEALPKPKKVEKKEEVKEEIKEEEKEDE